MPIKITAPLKKKPNYLPFIGMLLFFMYNSHAQYDPNFELRINAGGPQLNYGGETYLADQYFTNGDVYTNSQASVDALYSTERYRTNLTYEIPLENGDYDVILHYAEIYWGATGGATGGVGDRIFDVFLESQLVLDDFDMNTEVSAETPLLKSFRVSVLDGTLNLRQSSLAADGGVGHAKVAAIEVLGVNVGTNCQSGNCSQTVSSKISSSIADSEEDVSDGGIDTVSSDLELFNDTGLNRAQELGLHFTGLTIPAGVSIDSAYIQFSVDEVSTGAVSLNIYAEAADNPQIWTTNAYDISSRTKTNNTVQWSPPDWSTAQERGQDQQTPDLAVVIQELVDRQGYTEGDAINIIITGNSGATRIAESYNGVPNDAAELFITYSTGETNNGVSVWSEDNSTPNEPFIYYNDGNVGIGTTDPGTWKLAVNGKIRAKEIKVETGWADYVFEDGYNLPTLQEVENHIKHKGHLINIPSAKEVEANGIELGEMNRLLLEKIEELTLYVIEQNKRQKKLEKEISRLEND